MDLNHLQRWESNEHAPFRNTRASVLLRKCIVLRDLYNHGAGEETFLQQKLRGLIKRAALTEISLPHKIPVGHPPDSGDIHFPLIVFNSFLPLETASSHSSSLAAVTLKETPNQNICLSFSLRSGR